MSYVVYHGVNLLDDILLLFLGTFHPFVGHKGPEGE